MNNNNIFINNINNNILYYLNNSYSIPLFEFQWKSNSTIYQKFPINI